MHIKFRMLKCCVVYVMYHAGDWTEPAMLCKTYSINTQPQIEKCDHIEFLFILFFFCNCFFWVFNFVYLYVFIYVAFFPFGIQCSQKNTDILVQATFLLDTIAYFDKCHAFVLKKYVSRCYKPSFVPYTACFVSFFVCLCRCCKRNA